MTYECCGVTVGMIAMKMNNINAVSFLTLNTAALLCIVFAAGTARSEDNLSFKGALVAEPCVIAEDSQESAVDFGNIVDKYLYLNGESPKIKFTLKLDECDLDLASLASITFSGNESPVLSGYLQPDSGSQAKGIAIGIAQTNGTLLPLNHKGNTFHLESGKNMLELQAYIKAEPDAITNRGITQGVFSATATFSFSYE